MYLVMAVGLGLTVWPSIISHDPELPRMTGVVFALPRRLDGTLDEGMRSTIFDMSLGMVLLVVIPWRYVYANYVARPGESWKLRRSGNEGVPVRAGS